MRLQCAGMALPCASRPVFLSSSSEKVVEDRMSVRSLSRFSSDVCGSV